ncbi:hypothetical protein COCSUDRAFT_56271 [Coccomyxa subellipsoidea C-169]|uniref:Hexosyltransferase n=1 Tax=Coccomyxa subellipsoidea (strain C-169) TaxID=574566 RepID=I0YTV2_COCSC|nr:hypothetical protein COCSUDRAFT_56271 [Coccomyxa subellipsoidea C-169]EIE21821.1 hypothetical protein COCSUDRAFT_56271 [Coccomyxa subellipsoidea C-169]|eukprot:XP_005646365.1 hypothetical protein COCSUDRAFT_56271 [Coccomyxa subellipsoidea C-169]
MKLPFGRQSWSNTDNPRHAPVILDTGDHRHKDRHSSRTDRSSANAGPVILSAEVGVAGRNIYPVADEEEQTQKDAREAENFKDAQAMHLVYSACGETVKSEFFMSLKSLYLFAVSGFVREPAYYHIHVLSDGAVSKEDLASLRPLSNFKASVHPKFPGATTLFKLCSTERMYLHQHADFKDLDKVIYVDTDTLWLDDAVFWWTHFKHVGTMRAAFGLAENAGSGNGSWYINAPIPHHGERGVNAGTMMASLAAIRASNFTAERDAIIANYLPLNQLPLGDQDVLNIYGHDHPDQIYVMPCIFNFRFDAGCQEGQPVVLHGNRALKNNPSSSYNHLYTFFSKIGVANPASVSSNTSLEAF